MDKITQRYRMWSWIIIAGTALLRLLIVGRLGLSGDEAHYWAYSLHPALSYFDHPPLIGYIIKIFTAVFGATEFAVRLPAVLFFFLTGVILFRLTERLYGARAALWSVILLNVIPVFSFLGSVMTVPDAPLALCWIVFAYLFWQLIQTGKASLWYGLGVVLGIGLLSKYNAALLVVSAFVFLLFSKEHRPWLTKKEPYLALCIAGIIFLPVILWNLENNFASFGFQLSHGFGKAAPHFSPALLGRCLSAQAGYLSPLLFVLFLAVAVSLALRYVREKETKTLFVLAFSLPTLILFNAIASFNEILPHWPAMGYLVLIIGVADFTVRRWDGAWIRAAVFAGTGLGILLTLLIPLQALYKLLPPELFLPRSEALRLEDGITRAEKVDVTNEMYGWHEAGKKIADIIAAAPEPKPFVFTHRHYIASQLSFYVPGRPRIYCLSERVDAYDFWQRDLSALEGRDGIFVTNDYFFVDPQPIYPFASWQEHEPVEIHRAGRKIRIFWITYGRDFDLKALSPDYASASAGPPLTVAQGLRKLDYRLFWLINRELHFKALDIVMSAWTKVDVGLRLNTGLLLLIFVVGVVLRVTRPERFWPEFLLAIGIIVFGGMLANLLKDMVGRMRPLAIFGDQVYAFSERLYRGSFPSGHTLSAFSVATFLSMRLKRWQWLFFLAASMIGFSRVYIGVHFPIDVLGGAVIGIVTTVFLVKVVEVVPAFNKYF